MVNWKKKIQSDPDMLCLHTIYQERIQCKVGGGHVAKWERKLYFRIIQESLVHLY